MGIVSGHCVFCRILTGQKYQPILYRDELCAAFRDVDQPNPYQVLVVSNRHAESIYDLDAELKAHLTG